MLANYCRVCGLPLGAGPALDIPTVIPLKKKKNQAFCLAAAVKEQSQLGVDFLPTTSPP